MLLQWHTGGGLDVNSRCDTRITRVRANGLLSIEGGLLRVVYVSVCIFEVYIEFYILLVVRARLCVYLCARLCVCLRVCVCLCMCVCVFVCVFVGICPSTVSSLQMAC